MNYPLQIQWIRREIVLTIISFLMHMILIGCVFWLNYIREKEEIYKDIDKTLIAAATGQSLILHDEYHDRIAAHPPTYEEDQKNIILLNRFADLMKVQYIYTMIQKKGEIVFTASNITQIDAKKGKFTYYNDIYTDAPPSLQKVFKTKTTVFDEYTDQWGNFRSVFIPLISPEGRVYVAAADMPVDNIHSRLAMIQKTYLSAILLILFIGLPIVIWRFNTLHRKLLHEIKINVEKDRMMNQQANKAALGEIIGMIAHQWRQPLNAINAASVKLSLLNELGTIDPTELSDTLQFIQNMSQKMSITVNDFMEMTKPDRQRYRFYLKDAIDDAVKLIYSQFTSSDIDLKIEIGSDEAVYGYQKVLTHVLLNLIVNAKDAFENKSILQKTIQIRTRHTEDSVRIEIEDNAGGIDPLIIDKIFDPFFTTKPSGKGTGLGLYMSKKLIEDDFNGTVSVNNTDDGAIFSISFPNISDKSK